MRFRADENFDTLAVKALRDAGHDVSWIRDVEPGMPDEEIWDHAVRETRILLTFDKDFGEIAFVRMRSVIPGIILFRLHGVPADEIVAKITAAIAAREKWPGHFSVVDEKRIRNSAQEAPDSKELKNTRSVRRHHAVSADAHLEFPGFLHPDDLLDSFDPRDTEIRKYGVLIRQSDEFRSFSG